MMKDNTSVDEIKGNNMQIKISYTVISLYQKLFMITNVVLKQNSPNLEKFQTKHRNISHAF